MIIISFDMSSISTFTKVYRSLYLRLDKTHLRDNPLHSHILIDKVSLETTGCHIILPKVPLEVYVEILLFAWKLLLTLLLC